MATRSRQVRVIIGSLEGSVELIVKKLVLDFVANVQRAPSEGGTPVDTGWASANWVPNIGSPLEQPAGTRAQAESGTLPTASTTQSALVASSYKLTLGPVHVTNNVPYILKLNAGSSGQAPAGFVQRSIAKAVLTDLPGVIG